MYDPNTAPLARHDPADFEWVDYHVGDTAGRLARWRAFLHAHRSKGWAAVRAHAHRVMEMIAHPDVLIVAALMLRSGGPKAPGRNGLRLEALTDDEIRAMCRALSQAVRRGTYRPGRELVVWVNKTSGRGRRPLVLMDVQDRVVQKAAALVLRPLLDGLFDPLSFANRPWRSREQAVAAGELLATGGYPVWVLHDLKDAFRRVPLPRLLDVVYKLLPCPRLRDFLRLVLPPQARGVGGVKQGGPLSALMLEVYLWHTLDRPLRRSGVDVRLIRWADDLGLAARTVDDAVRADALVRGLTVPAGMRVKDGLANAAADLRDEAADWLGFRVDLSGDQFRVRLGADAFDRLGRRLVLAHAQCRPAERAAQVLECWVSQLGPCHRWEDRPAVLRGIARTARRYGFEEFAGDARLAEVWEEAAGRWERIRQVVRGTPGYLEAGPLAAPTPTSVVW